MSETTKWLIGIIVMMVAAYAAIVTDALIESRATSGQVLQHDFRLELLEREAQEFRARLRHLEAGGDYAKPEE